MSNTKQDETSSNEIVLAVEDLDESTFREALSQLATQYCKQTDNHRVAVDALELQASVVRAKASGSISGTHSTLDRNAPQHTQDNSYGVSWYSSEDR